MSPFWHYTYSHNFLLFVVKNIIFPDELRNKCDADAADDDGEVFIEVAYSEGSVVWAKVAGHAWYGSGTRAFLLSLRSHVLRSVCKSCNNFRFPAIVARDPTANRFAETVERRRKDVVSVSFSFSSIGTNTSQYL